MDSKIVGKKLAIDGYLYTRRKLDNGKQYWECVRYRAKECRARAITAEVMPGCPITVYRGPVDSSHEHPPNFHQVSAETVKSGLKRKAEENPGMPPAHILRTDLANITEGVLSQLPTRENLKKAMRRQRRANLPPNPRSLLELGELPDTFQHTLALERFLIHDSGVNQQRRVLVFATRQNLEILSKSAIWFLDGTFKVCPSIFTQMFTILGIISRRVSNVQEEVAVPLVYALLSSKETDQYAEVLQAVSRTAEQYHINDCVPQKIITDFEKGILRACHNVYPTVSLSCCFFHLSQSVYRKVQALGLQNMYTDPVNDELRMQTHMLAALAFVPSVEVARTFHLLKSKALDELVPVFEYLDEVYVSGKRAMGRRRAVPPQYAPPVWNQHEAALHSSHKTNNFSEGWHNRFQVVVNKHYPDMYSALKEIQKEQADTEIAIAEVGLGKKVKAAPKQKWLEFQRRIQSIVQNYAEYKNRGEDLEFLRLTAHNINL